jgi:hypothetical protein
MTSLLFYDHDGRMACPKCGVTPPHTHEFDEVDIRRLVHAGHKVNSFRVSTFAAQVLAERQRQIDIEGFTAERDVAAYPRGELIKAAICYAFYAAFGSLSHTRVDGERIRPRYVLPVEVAALVKAFWPWDFTWWKPQTRRRALVKAAALLIAEGDRQDAASDQATASLEAELPESMR